MTIGKATHASYYKPRISYKHIGHRLGHSCESPLRLRLLSIAVPSGSQCCIPGFQLPQRCSYLALFLTKPLDAESPVSLILVRIQLVVNLSRRY